MSSLEIALSIPSQSDRYLSQSACQVTTWKTGSPGIPDRSEGSVYLSIRGDNCVIRFNRGGFIVFPFHYESLFLVDGIACLLGVTDVSDVSETFRCVYDAPSGKDGEHAYKYDCNCCIHLNRYTGLSAQR